MKLITNIISKKLVKSKFSIRKYLIKFWDLPYDGFSSRLQIGFKLVSGKRIRANVRTYYPVYV